MRCALLSQHSLCWLVVSSGEVLPESFSVGSGGKPFVVVLVRVFPMTVLCSTVPWWFWWRFSQDWLALLLLAVMFSLMVRVVWSFGSCVLVKLVASLVLSFPCGTVGQWIYSCHLSLIVSCCLPGQFGALGPCWFSARVGADVAYCALSGLQFFACGFLAGAFGSTVCSCSSISVLYCLEPWCIVLYLGWLLMLVIAPCIVSCALIVSFVHRFTTSPGIGGVELSASGTLCPGLCLVVAPLPLWGGCFALSSCFGSCVVVHLFGGWHVGTHAELRVLMAGVLPTLCRFSIVRGVDVQISCRLYLVSGGIDYRLLHVNTVNFGIAWHLWGCRSVWTPHEWL
ncbi:hypothetical protein Taro_053215, partial [Colocasia esculenta]|nr:hypothetical protein [Colocasia esculenta]